MEKRMGILAIMISMLWLCGCRSMFFPHQRNYKNSSVVDFLYPKSKQQEVAAEIPRLTLPLKVGVAFTPGTQYYAASGLSETNKVDLMTNISLHFQAMPFVEAIEVIPSGYLRPEGSFENLDQLKRMFDIDVIALVSYDQTRFTDESFASIAYWTIVGAYIIPAEKNSTHTMLDAVVYDIDSRKLLFRAPGTSSVKSRSTFVSLPEKVREDSDRGFDQASEDLVNNLKLQLDHFKEKVEQSPEEYQVVRSEGYQGSGSGDLWFLSLVSLLGFQVLRRW